LTPIVIIENWSITAMDKNIVEKLGPEVVAALDHYTAVLKQSPSNPESLRIANNRLEIAIENSQYFKSSNDQKAVIREFYKTAEREYKPVYDDIIKALEQRRITEALEIGARPLIYKSKHEKETSPEPKTETKSDPNRIKLSK
jgi:hypothetical protein